MATQSYVFSRLCSYIRICDQICKKVLVHVSDFATLMSDNFVSN